MWLLQRSCGAFTSTILQWCLISKLPDSDAKLNSNIIQKSVHSEENQSSSQRIPPALEFSSLQIWPESVKIFGLLL